MEKITIEDKFALFSDYWSPKIVDELNDSFIKFAKLKGEFVWHKHEKEDEMFLVVKGHLTIKFRDKDVHLQAGDLIVVPKGIEHLPVAQDEVHVILVEPKSTINTGDIISNKTKLNLDKI